MHGNADCIDGAVISNALREAKDALFRAGNLHATSLDALVEVCTRSLGALISQSRRDLYRIYMHLDTEGAWMHKGGPVPPALLATFMCDGQVRPVWTTGGLPVNVGRSQHIVSLHTRLLVENRDRMRRRPTCASTHGLEVHHVIPWAPADRWAQRHLESRQSVPPRSHRASSRRVHHHRQRRRDRRTRLPRPAGADPRGQRSTSTTGRPATTRSRTALSAPDRRAIPHEVVQPQRATSAAHPNRARQPTALIRQLPVERHATGLTDSARRRCSHNIA